MCVCEGEDMCVCTRRTSTHFSRSIVSSTEWLWVLLVCRLILSHYCRVLIVIWCYVIVDAYLNLLIFLSVIFSSRCFPDSAAVSKFFVVNLFFIPSVLPSFLFWHVTK
jgi:hypothetical protein